VKGVRKSELIGRKIVDVDWRPFDDGMGGKATNPILILDNGRHIYFLTQETEIGEYGVELCITAKENKSNARTNPV
jgi:hypothetical protein